MKKLYNIILFAIILFACSSFAQAQDCDLPISVVLYPQNEELPQAAESVLENQLSRIAATGGLDTGLSFGQFVLTARIDILEKNVLPGPPIQVVNDLGVTFYIVDSYTKTKFATEYIEVNGIGSNETKSLINAVRGLNANNAKISALLKNGKKKIMEYFDNNYSNILKDAERKASLQQYERAIALVASIPACSKGGDIATQTMLTIYTKYLDKYNQMLLNKANAIWNARQSYVAATEAGEILALIDPEAACYKDAVKLATEIKSQVRKDIDFEMREKYHNDIELEKKRIEAIRDIGVAFGKGQKEQTTNLTWLK